MKILIAVPTFENIYPDTFKSIYDLDKCGQDVIFEFVRGYDCATARNKVVAKAQELKADYILMVDNDVVLPKNILEILLEDKKDVCLGYYAHRASGNVFEGKACICKLGERNYTQMYTEDELKAYRDNGKYLIQIHGGGMGCAFIKTSVFNRIKYPYYDWVNYKDMGMLSEDLYFCEQCKWNKIPIYADTRAKCGHIFRHIQNMA